MHGRISPKSMGGKYPLQTFAPHNNHITAPPCADMAISGTTEATITGSGALHHAGNTPLKKPITRAIIAPCINRSEDSLKLNTTRVKLPPKVEALIPSKSRLIITQLSRNEVGQK
jgi:hypothetical protein